MGPDEITRLIGTVGFPITAAAYLLHWMTTKLNGKFDRLTDAVERNTAAVELLAQRRVRA